MLPGLSALCVLRPLVSEYLMIMFLLESEKFLFTNLVLIISHSMPQEMSKMFYYLIDTIIELLL